MPKRFTETLKWDDPWFRALSPDAKLLWFWLVDKCDNAGIITPDFALCEFQTGIKRAFERMTEIESRVAEISEGKFIICKFIEFQHGKLSRDCKAHNPAFQSLQKHGMIDENGEIKGYPKGIHTLSIGYPYSTGIGKGKGKEIGNGKSTEKEEIELPFSSPDFLMFWSNWEQHRIEIKKKLTPTTKKQQLTKLGEMGEARAIAALKHSLAGGWQGIFEPQGAAATSTSIPDDEAVLLMGAIDSIRSSWQKIPWNNEDRAALIKYQEQLAALTDDDLQLLKAYFESTAEGYFRPDNRSKFCESLSGIWTACERWKKATGYRAPNSRDSLYYGS
jgi:hypothetical protein